MEVLIAFIVAILIAAVIWFIASQVPPTRRYAAALGLIAGALYLLFNLGLL